MSRQRALPRKRLPWKRLLLTGLALPVLLLGVLVAVAYARTDVPEPDSLAVAGATRILYSDGSELGRTGDQNRLPVELEQVPLAVQQAVLAAEDRGFYTEPGISPKGIARALLTNVRGGGEIQQGGSTITQQYAKNAFLAEEDGSFARTYSRKVKEVLISLKMTRTVPKEQILQDYLNTIFFGRGAYGIQVASSAYFGKPVEELTTAEGAVLAASLRAPSSLDPETDPERARDRWGYVLDGMVEQGWLDAAERDAATYPAVRPAAEAQKNNDLSGPKGHVITRVMKEVEAVLEERGQSDLLPRGLTVTSTIRREAQDAAVAAVQEVVGDGSDETAVKGALVSVEPGTGAVVAYYGGGGGTGFDYAGQGEGRQPGSSFKPFVLASALEQGRSLRSTLDGNSPKDFRGIPDPIQNFGSGSGQDFGRVTLVEATQRSVNTAYFELGLDVGPKAVAELAHRAGIPDAVPLANDDGNTEGGIALGTYNVHVIDQAVGYATFAAGGMAAEPFFVSRMVAGDNEVYAAQPEVERAFGEDVAADATSALQAVVARGTGTRARLDGGRPAAGKTGTTSDNYDAWFVGYTPQMSTAVWIGTGENKTIELPGVREVTGGVVSAGIWKDYTDAALQGVPIERFPPAANVGRAQRGSSSSSSSGSRADDDDDETAPRPRRSRAPRRSSSPSVQSEPTGEPTQAPAPEPVEPTQAPAPQPQPESEPPAPSSRPSRPPGPPPAPEPAPTGDADG